MTCQTSITWFVRAVHVCLFTAIGSIAFAEGNEAVKESPAPAPKYTVWRGGGCSRSLREVKSHENVVAAIVNAEALKEQGGIVLIVEGDSTWGDALDAYNVLRGVSKEMTLQCTVYERACLRAGWQKSTEFDKSDYKSASEHVAKLKDSRTATAVVYHARKKS